MAIIPQSPPTTSTQLNKLLPITIISHIQPFLPSPREPIFSNTCNHAPSSPATLTVSSPHVNTSPTTAPRVSLSGTPSSCMFRSPLLLSLSVSFLSSPLVNSLLVFYPLIFFTNIHTGIVPRSWSNWKQSSIPSVVAGYGNERYGAESRAKREGETGGEEKERRLRRKDDTQVTLCFLLSFHIQIALVGGVL